MKLLLAAWLAQGALLTVILSLLLPWETAWQPMLIAFLWPIMFIPHPSSRVNHHGQHVPLPEQVVVDRRVGDALVREQA